MASTLKHEDLMIEKVRKLVGHSHVGVHSTREVDSYRGSERTIRMKFTLYVGVDERDFQEFFHADSLDECWKKFALKWYEHVGPKRLAGHVAADPKNPRTQDAEDT